MPWCKFYYFYDSLLAYCNSYNIVILIFSFDMVYTFLLINVSLLSRFEETMFPVLKFDICVPFLASNLCQVGYSIAHVLLIV